MAKKKDLLTEKELDQFQDAGPFYVPGKPYMWVMSFGWCIIGFYIGHETPLTIRVAHANHFQNAGVDYGVLAQEGPDPTKTCQWRYEGNSLLSFHSILRADDYGGSVPRGRITTE